MSTFQAYDLAIVGAGIVALEFARVFQLLGARVTLLPAISDARHASMLAEVRRHAADFSWARPESRAYDRTIELLRRRASEK